ncbi:MAG: hypothetical protein IAE90_09515 [Ignavibacteria bacterium]|nr:hypothetical protein [Ignavibacteria bacterium]
MGINIDVHYRFDTIEEWNEYGHTLAPKQIWEKCLTKPGLKSLTITQSEREDGNIGFIQVKTEASTITNPGILISVNDHFEIGSEEPNSSKIISQLLEENWDKSTERAQFIIENLINFDKD